jgi:hypothetical protein
MKSSPAEIREEKPSARAEAVDANSSKVTTTGFSTNSLLIDRGYG